MLWCIRAKYIAMSLLLLTIILITPRILVSFVLHAQAQNTSPSFVRQQVNDEINDTKQFIRIENNSQKRNGYDKNPLSESIDIQRVSYSSDGNFLNATIWLGGTGVKENPSLYGASMVAYGMVIDADNNEKTGKAGFDYQVEVQWNNGTWHRTYVEWGSDNTYRLISSNQNYTGFF